MLLFLWQGTHPGGPGRVGAELTCCHHKLPGSSWSWGDPGGGVLSPGEGLPATEVSVKPSWGVTVPPGEDGRHLGHSI